MFISCTFVHQFQYSTVKTEYNVTRNYSNMYSLSVMKLDALSGTTCTPLAPETCNVRETLEIQVDLLPRSP